MDGRWAVLPAGTQVHDRDDGVRVLLANNEWTAVGQRVHDVALVSTVGEADVIGDLGPDLLGADWDADLAAELLARRPDRPIGEALLDQHNLAGIGNVYKAELCFLRGISPWTPVGEVADLRRLVELARRLLLANRSRVDQVTTGDPRPGRQVYVYDRAGRPCRRCGVTIESAWQGADERRRISYWCPRCQPGPRPGP